MCYSGVALVNLRDLAVRRRWHALQASMVAVATAEAANYVHEPSYVAAEVAGGGGGAVVKQYCLCSPTQHPGSFRCRQHQAEYAWAGRTLRKRLTN